MAISKTGNQSDDDRNSFIDNENGQVSRSVVDEEGNRLLDQINNALGGASNTSPSIYNINTVENTEVAQALPSNTKYFVISARGNSRIQLAYVALGSGSNFRTIWPGAEFRDSNYYTNQTLYFQTSKDDIIELIVYV